MLDMIDIFASARRVSTPIVGIKTFDAQATELAISMAYSVPKGEGGREEAAAPLISWDAIQGLRGINEQGRVAVKQVLGQLEQSETRTPVDALAVVAGKELPLNSMLFFHNLQMFLNLNDQASALIVQALANIRDNFKTKHATLNLLGPDFSFPPEIAQHVTVIDEPLPTDDQLEIIIAACHEQGKLAVPTKKQMEKAVNALRGLAAFPAEQVTAMSLTKQGLDMDGLWERKRKMIEATNGLTIWRGKESLSEVHGLDNLMSYAKPFLPNISLVVYLDEIEKMVAGAQGDTSGVSQAMHQYLLTFMADRDVVAVLLVGHPGTGKSMFAKAAGNGAGAPVISLDINGVKDPLVGNSERNARTCFKVIDAVGGGRVMLIATCNDYQALSPELRSRFLDTFFVELPTDKARSEMQEQYCAEFKVKNAGWPSTQGWTGREIRYCARTAMLRGTEIKEAAKYVIPISVSAADKVARLREASDGRFLDAANPGIYSAKQATANTGRIMSMN